MKLEEVELKDATMAFKTRWIQAKQGHKMSWDEGSLVVRIDGQMFPLMHVVRMMPATSVEEIEETMAAIKRASELVRFPPEADPRTTPLECDKCGVAFDDPRKLGGHKRHCKGRIQ